MKELVPIAGVILAGGLSSRMGGRFKGDTLIGKLTLLEMVIQRFRPQVDTLLVNLNQQNITTPLRDLTVIPDSVKNHPGPLAGLLAAFEHLEARDVNYGAVAVVPCDGPYLPDTLVSALAQAMSGQQARVACVRYRGEIQPTFSLWHRSAGPAIAERLRMRSEGGFKGLFDELATVFVDWPASEFDPFFNINTPQDAARAQATLEAVP